LYIGKRGNVKKKMNFAIMMTNLFFILKVKYVSCEQIVKKERRNMAIFFTKFKNTLAYYG